MVDILVGNKNTIEIDILCQELANDKSYKINNVSTGIDAVNMYWKLNPDIFVLDNSISDMCIENIIDKLSCSPVEQKKTNTILTLPKNYSIELHNVSKLNRIIYKPILHNELINTIQVMSADFNTPDLEIGEVDWLLQSLNFNCMSTGYRYMKDAITYCYYKPDELELLNNVLQYLAYKYNVPESRVRDTIKNCIRPFNNTNEYNCPQDLLNVLSNRGYKLSPKDFLERIVLYLIREKKKGRLF